MCAYFSNSSDDMLSEECGDCILAELPCPIALVQMMYNYDACNVPVARDILNHLVKQGERFAYIGCQMKPLLDKYKEKEDPNQGKLFQ